MKIKIAAATAVSCVFVTVGTAMAAAPPSNPTPTISRDEQQIYEEVLSSWLGDEHGRQLVNSELSPAPSLSDPDVEECVKGLRFPAGTETGKTQKSFAGVQFKGNRIELVDGAQWSPTDPGQGIAKGKSVEAAVQEGISHSLISFSQIAFDASGKHALVRFGMVCGRLCGSGSTIHLHKTGSGWVVSNRCGGWIS